MLARVTQIEHDGRYGEAVTREGKAVRFHESEVQGGLTSLAVGDEVRITKAARLEVRRTGRPAA